MRDEDLALTVEERVLLHLAQFFYNPEDYEAPRDCSQEGIAEAIGISFTHVPRAVDALRKKDLLAEHKMHTPGADRKRKTYLLTHAGYQRADEIKERVLGGEVLVRRERGLEPVLVSELLGPSASNADLLRLVVSARAVPVVEAEPLRARPSPEAVAAVSAGHIPRVREWVGRKEELRRLQAMLRHAETRLIAVTGVAGIGKTTLVAKALEKHRDKVPLLFYRLREWDALRHLGLVVGDFLATLGRPAFKEYVEGRTEYDLAEALRILEEGLSGLAAVIVLDDFEKASRTVVPFVGDFVAHLEHLPGATLVLVSRERPRLVRESDLAAGRAAEIHVEGLDERAARQLVRVKRAPPDYAQRLWRVTNGHPLLLKLAAALPAPLGEGEDAARVLHATSLARFLQEEIVASLGPEERRVLELASVHRLPFPPHALFVEPTVRFDTLDRLRGRMMVRDVGGRALEVVEFIREFVYARLPPEERRRNHALAAQHYRGLADDVAGWEGLYHLQRSGEAEQAARLAVERAPRAFERGQLEELNATLRECQPAQVPTRLYAEVLVLRADILARWGSPAKAAQVLRDAARLCGEALAPANRRLLAAEDGDRLEALRAQVQQRLAATEDAARQQEAVSR